jgi:hypothetical protein
MLIFLIQNSFVFILMFDKFELWVLDLNFVNKLVDFFAGRAPMMGIDMYLIGFRGKDYNSLKKYGNYKYYH